MSWFPCSKSGGGIKKGGILSSQAAAPGQSGYINFARIKILDNYANHTCYFTIQNRGVYFPILLSIGFQNINHTDPELISFLYWGATDYGIYAVRNTISTWDLYVNKTEPHDTVEILSLVYDTSHFEITFPNGFYEEKGDGWMSPQPGGRVAGADHVYDSGNGGCITFSYNRPEKFYDNIIWVAVWDGYEMRAMHKHAFTYVKLTDGLFGMCIPPFLGGELNDQAFIRTTKEGIIPYSANSSEGKSSLGTETWPFAECYAKKIVANQIHVSNNFQYTQGSYAHTIINMTGSFINFTSTVDTKHGVGIQTSPANMRVSIHPLTSVCADLGRSDRLWRDIYANNATIQTSDRNQKKDISYIGTESEYENTQMSDDTLIKFVRNLRPCIFLMKNGESGRPHHGFISQDFKETMDKLGIADHAAYIKSPKTETIEKEIEQERKIYDEVEKKNKVITEKIKVQEDRIIKGEFDEGLRYEEIIPDVTRFCQILYQQNQEQEKKIEDLESRIKVLEDIIKQGA